MPSGVKTTKTLRGIIWADVVLGGGTSIGLFLFSSLFSRLFGISSDILLIIALITFGYAVVATLLVRQNTMSVPLLKTLVWANWVWALISVALLIWKYNDVTPLGLTFLLLQIVVVGGLAYLEGNQLQSG
jgi:hypothetical protein